MKQANTSARVPSKWRKYLLLSLFGLASEDKLSETIIRFPFDQLHDCKRSILAALAREPSARKNMVVIKLVSMPQSRRLPNYIVTCPNDVIRAFSKIEKRASEGWAEIWYCLNDVSSDTFSVGGRFIPDPLQIGAIQTLEQVWHTSPRLIEQLSKRINFPYLRADHSGFSRRLDIATIFIPKGYPIDRTRMVNEYHQVLRFIRETEESWTALVMYLVNKGVDTVALEYKVNNGEFSFIDWDSEDDEKII